MKTLLSLFALIAPYSSCQPVTSGTATTPSQPACAVLSVRRGEGSVIIDTSTGKVTFDHCNPDTKERAQWIELGKRAAHLTPGK